MSAPRSLLDVARRIQRPTVFRPGEEPEELPTLHALQSRIRALAGPSPSFRIGHAAYPGFDPFPCVTVYGADGPVCFFADRWHDEGDVRVALKILQAAA